jgi:hypothetical protein
VTGMEDEPVDWNREFGEEHKSSQQAEKKHRGNTNSTFARLGDS